jgi:Carboxypeptidase regulatory-like domain
MSKIDQLIFCVAVMFGQKLLASSICAVVTDIVNEPIRGAVIYVSDIADAEHRLSARTDLSGKACVASVPDGRFSVEATAPGFMTAKYYPVRVEAPGEVTFTFRLPIGSFDRLRSTYVGSDSMLYGTLTDGTATLDHLRICLFDTSKVDVSKCTESNEVGQYEITVSPGQYRVEISSALRKLFVTKLDARIPGYYRNRISLAPSDH